MNSFRQRNARFDRLVRPLFDRMYRVACQLTGDRQSAEDVLQDALIKLFKNVDQLERIDPLEPWVLRVVHNTFIDHYRKRRRDERIVEPVGGEQTAFLTLVGAPSEKSDVDRLGDLDSIVQSLAGLSPEHRAVIVLHDIQGYSLEEMQKIVNAPVGTIKSRIHRARKHLRDRLRMEQNP